MPRYVSTASLGHPFQGLLQVWSWRALCLHWRLTETALFPRRLFLVSIETGYFLFAPLCPSLLWIE